MVKQKRRNKGKKKIAHGHNQIDALSTLLKVEGVNGYEVDIDSVFDPTQTFKQNKNHLLNAIADFKRDNDIFLHELQNGLFYTYIPFMMVFYSFWMYFEAVLICMT